MEVIIRCPNCGMELEAPSDLIGRAALCPGCQVPFVVRPIDANETEAAPRTGDVVSSAAAPQKRADEIGSRGEQRERSAGRPSSTDPADVETRRSESQRSETETAPATAPAGAPRFKGLDPSLLAELGGDSGASGKKESGRSERKKDRKGNGDTKGSVETAPPLEPISDEESRSMRTSKPAKRERRAARLVTETGDAGKLALGADGQLPQLVVKETTAVEKPRDAESDSNPMVLIIAVAFSVLISVVLLFAPTGGGSAQADVSDSLAALQEHYIGRRQPLEPYQVMVREALQCENKGDRGSATAIYRRLLDMIHAERQDPNQGLTGPKISLQEPNDQRLEAHLKVLLAR
ncbi:MAG TPA: hypothetical protein DCQ98_07480 [Planctomycetaceae bacterium]|nr:hypothetical protein [Planctomycetaceae bacterium]HRF00299.1 hypothetical protein [Pirellulaceae bacterium]